MIFSHDGKKYDTAAMKRYDVGIGSTPYLYLTADGREVFVLEYQYEHGIDLRPAGAQEIRWFVDYHGIKDLKRALNTQA